MIDQIQKIISWQKQDIVNPKVKVNIDINHNHEVFSVKPERKQIRGSKKKAKKGKAILNRSLWKVKPGMSPTGRTVYVWMLKLLIKLSVAMTMEGKGKPGDYNDDIYDNDDIPTIVACHVSLFVSDFIGIVQIYTFISDIKNNSELHNEVAFILCMF